MDIVGLHLNRVVALVGEGFHSSRRICEEDASRTVHLARRGMGRNLFQDDAESRQRHEHGGRYARVERGFVQKVGAYSLCLYHNRRGIPRWPLGCEQLEEPRIRGRPSQPASSKDKTEGQTHSEKYSDECQAPKALPHLFRPPFEGTALKGSLFVGTERLV